MPQDIFTKRGIMPDVRDARPYVRFDQDDLEIRDRKARIRDDASHELREFVAGDPTTKPSRLNWIADSSGGGGWLMAKHPVPGKQTPIATQVRSDRPALIWEEARQEHRPAKYLMARKPPGTWEHDHTNYQRASEREKHVANKKHHNGTDVLGLHEHESHRIDTGESPEKRLDLHPMSAALLPTAGRVFFVIEGVLKADALLSAGECSFDVPSVAMWDARELRTFARRHLRGRPVYIVPDADWVANDEVALQAFTCRDRLRSKSYGSIDAYVITWALEDGHEGKDCKREDCTKGVDDYLGRGGSIADAEIVMRELSLGFHAWSEAHRHAGRWDATSNDIKVLAFLATHADENGQAKLAAATIGKHVGLTPKTVHRPVERLIEAGVVSSDRKLKYMDERLLPVVDRDTGKPKTRYSVAKGKRVGVYRDLGEGWVGKVPSLLLREDVRANKERSKLPTRGDGQR